MFETTGKLTQYDDYLKNYLLFKTNSVELPSVVVL